MRQLIKERRVLAEYLKNDSADFHQTHVSFRHVYIEVFETKD